MYFAGSLTLYMKPVKGERVKIFSDSLNQGDVWRHGNGNISSALVDWQVQYGGRRAAGTIILILLRHFFMNEINELYELINVQNIIKLIIIIIIIVLTVF